ncbi:hypothetical protein F5146DRAFT_1144562 [Armillaria mellea]|nr:hypothetical protein F5146DRAFT_1144562 [Armillaria mellea]
MCKRKVLPLWPTPYAQQLARFLAEGDQSGLRNRCSTVTCPGVWLTSSSAAAPQTATSPITSPFFALCQLAPTGTLYASSEANSITSLLPPLSPPTPFSTWIPHAGPYGPAQVGSYTPAQGGAYAPPSGAQQQQQWPPPTVPWRLQHENIPTQKRQVDKIERRVNQPFDVLHCETLSKPVPEQL